MMRVAALCLLATFTTTDAARIKQHQQASTFRGWSKGDTFICMKKWQKNRGAAGGRGRERYCLVNFEQIWDARSDVKSKKLKMTASTSWGMCESLKNTHNMKLCNLKGKQDKRVSYKDRVHVPKKCFSFASENFKSTVSLFVTSTTARECNSIIHRKPAGYGMFAPTITPAPTSAPTEEPEDEPIADEHEDEAVDEVEDGESTVDDIEEPEPEEEGTLDAEEVESVETEPETTDPEDEIAHDDHEADNVDTDLGEEEMNDIFRFWKNVERETLANQKGRTPNGL